MLKKVQSVDMWLAEGKAGKWKRSSAVVQTWFPCTVTMTFMVMFAGLCEKERESCRSQTSRPAIQLSARSVRMENKDLLLVVVGEHLNRPERSLHRDAPMTGT